MKIIMIYNHCLCYNQCSKITQYLVSKVSLFLFLADCIDLDLGMENGAIPDNKIAATSELSAVKLHIRIIMVCKTK